VGAALSAEDSIGTGRATRPGTGLGTQGLRYTPACHVEDPPIDLDALVKPILVPLAAGLAVAVLLLAAIVAVQARRLGLLSGRLDGMTRGSDGRSLETALSTSLQRTEVISREVDDLVARSAVIEADLRTALQKVGFVRFNPFEETGGNQSFALALMDAEGNGFVVSSLHARTGTRVYGKALIAGRAETALSAEETEAVRIALAAPRRGRG
jgi:hypothetical protein